MKIVAKNKKTGAKYVFAEIYENAPQLCAVSTLKAWPQTWNVDTSSVDFDITEPKPCPVHEWMLNEIMECNDCDNHLIP